MHNFTTDPITTARRCGNNGCAARNPWPLHHIVRRANLRLLCTSCVLRQHHGFFCSLCLQLLDSPPPASSDATIARCLRCPAAVHISCLKDESLSSNYLCPVCEDGDGFSYFRVGESGIDAAAARALLAAARIAAGSMSRAAAEARLEAERKMGMAAVAREVAKEMVERVMVASRKRKEGMEGGVRVMKRKKRRKRRIKMVALSSPSGVLQKL